VQFAAEALNRAFWERPAQIVGDTLESFLETIPSVGSADNLQSGLSQMRKEKQSAVIVATMRASLLHARAAFMKEHYAPQFFCSNVNRMSVRSCAMNW